jgi:hypothetical protein
VSRGYTHPDRTCHPFGPRPFDRHWDARYFVYTLTGPTGVYVGSSTDPERRFRSHRAKANCAPTARDQMITLALRHDGCDSYVLEVFGSAIGLPFSEDIEYALVTKLRGEGKRVLNVLPRTPLHTAPCFGRFVGVVVNGRVEPLFPAAEGSAA